MRVKQANTIKLKSKLIALAILIAIFVVLLLLKNNIKVADWIVTHISQRYIAVATTVFGWIPFSMYELFLIVTILLLVTSVVMIIIHLVKKHYRRCLSIVIVVAICGVSFGGLYTVVAGMSYNRSQLDIPSYSVRDNGVVDYQEVLNISETYLSQLNSLADTVKRKTDGTIDFGGHQELVSIINKAYSNMSINNVADTYVNAKKIANGWIMSQMRIAGVFFAPFGEANVNSRVDSYALPVTLAHEIAHGKGIMRESDANTLARYICFASDDATLKYSAMLSSLSTVTYTLSLYPNSSDDCQKIYDMVSDTVYEDIRYNNDFWNNYTLFGDIGQFFNDIYLKLSGVENGTGSYNPPPDIEDTGDYDDDGNEIVVIYDYTPMQNMIFQMYYDGILFD